MPNQPELEVIEVNDLRWTIRRDLPRVPLLPILEKPEEFLRNAAQGLKQSKTVTVVAIDAALDRPALVLRRLNYGQRKHRVKDFLRRGRVLRALDYALRLEAAQIRTPRAYAAATVRRLHWPVRAYLLMEKVERAVTLKELLAGNQPLPPRLVSAAADLLARMHNQGFSHRDLKTTNILVQDGSVPWIIDLDGVRQYQMVPRNRAISDLARILQDLLPFEVLHRRAAWRFLIAYCRNRGWADVRSAARAIRERGSG